MSRAKEIKNLVTSVKSTMKITKAMELVATSKMKRTQQKAKFAQKYIAQVNSMIGQFQKSNLDFYSSTSKQDSAKKAFIFISTDRGLCGGLNVNELRRFILSSKQLGITPQTAQAHVFGKKGASGLRRIGYDIDSFESSPEKPNHESITAIIGKVYKAFLAEEVSEVHVVYNKFINSMTQEPVVERLLPFSQDEFAQDAGARLDYIFESRSTETLLAEIIEHYLEAKLHFALLQNSASEQAARMLAMKNSTDNAAKMVESLQLEYNKRRQAAITQEIAEIVGGAASL